VNKLLVLLVGDVGVARQLKVLPGLIDLYDLTINILVNLFGLLVVLDDLPRAHSAVVGVDLCAALDELPNGGDLREGGLLQIFEAGIAARDRLPRLLLNTVDLNTVGRFVHRVEREISRLVPVGSHCDYRGHRMPSVAC
jgi:hypothetical protein